MSNKVPASVSGGFALGAAAYYASYQVVTVLALRFLTDNLAMSAALAALLFAITKVYDALIDPFVGYASDRVQTRWGRRRPFLFAAGIIMPVAIVGLFAAPQIASPTLMACYIGFMLMLWGTGYSLYVVPSAAMAVEVTDDYHQRSSLITVKLYGLFAGQVIGSSLPPWLLTAWGGGRPGHARMALVLAAIVGGMALLSVPLLGKARSTPRATRPSTGLFGQARVAWTNRPFRIIMFVHIVFLLGTAMSASSNAYFTRYVLQRTDAWLGTFYVFLTLGNIVGLPFWLWLSKRVDKKNAYRWALGIYGLAVLSWSLAGPSNTIALLGLRGTLTGIAMSGVLMLAQSMLTDAVRYDYVRTGLRREGAFSGFMSLIDKLSSAGGLMTMGVLLSGMGYAAGSGGGAAQSAGTVTAIYWSFAIVPALTALVSVMILGGYTLTAEDLDESAVQAAAPDPEAPAPIAVAR